MFLRRKEAGHPNLLSGRCLVIARCFFSQVWFSLTLYTILVLWTTRFLGHIQSIRQCSLCFTTAHCNKCWCLCGDVSVMTVALYGPAPESTWPCEPTAPAPSPSGSFTHWSAPSWSVFLDSWAPRGENHLGFWHATGTHSIWSLSVSKPSFPRIREWGQERVSELPNGHSGR